MILSISLAFLTLTTTWDANDVFNKTIIIGERNPTDTQFVKDIISNLTQQLEYWRERGLAQPPQLEGIYYITNYNNINWIDLLQVLNPKIPDIKSHIIAQYEHLKKSKVGELLVSLGKKQTDPNTYLNKFFDFYARLRYGFTCADFYETVLKNPIAATALKSSRADNFDNAYYGRFPAIDLTEILPDPKTSSEFIVAVKVHNLFKKNPSRRIVILPRLTQSSGDAAVSTAADLSVSRHEMGHVMVDGQNQDFQTDRTIDEVFADWLQASTFNDPLIGKHFATAGTEIGRRLEGEPFSVRNYLTKLQLDQLAEKGWLRNLTTETSLPALPRKWFLADDYEGGNPLRWMLWAIGNDSRVDKKTFETIALKSILAYSSDPVAIPDSAQIVIYFRTLFSMFLDFGGKAKILKENDLAAEVATQTKISGDDHKALNEGLAKLKLNKQKRESETKAAAERGNAFSHRPLIKSDIVIPQFLRNLYEYAYDVDPKIAAVIREYAERVTESRSHTVSTKDGGQSLVFDRNWFDQINPISRLRSNGLVRKLDRLEVEWMQLSEKDELESDAAKTVKRKFALALDQLTQYERTSSVWHLYVPHPWLSTAKTGGKLALFGLKVLTLPLKVIARKKQPCENELEKLKK